jgi:hypothetical protein
MQCNLIICDGVAGKATNISEFYFDLTIARFSNVVSLVRKPAFTLM